MYCSSSLCLDAVLKKSKKKREMLITSWTRDSGCKCKVRIVNMCIKAFITLFIWVSLWTLVHAGADYYYWGVSLLCFLLKETLIITSVWMLTCVYVNEGNYGNLVQCPRLCVNVAEGGRRVVYMPDVCLLNSPCWRNPSCSPKRPCGETGKSSAGKRREGKKQSDVNESPLLSPSAYSGVGPRGARYIMTSSA